MNLNKSKNLLKASVPIIIAVILIIVIIMVINIISYNNNKSTKRNVVSHKNATLNQHYETTNGIHISSNYYIQRVGNTIFITIERGNCFQERNNALNYLNSFNKGGGSMKVTFIIDGGVTGFSSSCMKGVYIN
jgi:hypothetical protein